MDNCFSVVYIAKNEEENMAESLKALLRRLGDPEEKQYEILVLDTGSTDQTEYVADSLGARVEHFEWINDFSAARNEAMKKALYDRILFIDADEILERIDYSDIIKLWNKYPEAIGRIERRNLCNNGDGGTCILVDRVERFFDRRFYHYEGKIHEQVVKNDGGQLYGYHIPFTVYHEGYYGTEQQLKEKAERNNKLLYEELRDNPNDSYIYYQLGQSYDLIGDFNKSQDCYEKCYALDPDRNADYTGIMICSLGNSYLKNNRIDEAIKLAENEYDNYSVYADFLCFAGNAYMKFGDFEKSIKLYKSAFGANLVRIEGCSDSIPSYNLGCIYEALGDELNAKKYYEKAVENGYARAKERLNDLLSNNYYKRAYEKFLSIIIPICDGNSFKAQWNNIKNQSIGIGHIEVIFVVMTNNQMILEELIDIEKEYENSVVLFYPENQGDIYCDIGTAFGYTTSEYALIIAGGELLKWDSFRMMYMAAVKTDADVVTHGIDYSGDDFLLTITDEQMRDNVRKVGVLSSAPVCSLYKINYLISKEINPQMLMESSEGQLRAEKIYCINERLKTY